MSFKIEYFDSVPLKGSCKLLDNKLTTSTNQEITFPSAGGELATKSDVSGGVDLSEYAKKSEIPETPDLSSYATQSWVGQQGYLTSHQSLNGYATQSWVGQQGYLTAHQSLTDYVTKTGSQTLTNKTLTTPVISSIKNSSYTLTVPSKTGTLATTSDIFTPSMVQSNASLSLSGISGTTGTATYDQVKISSTLCVVCVRGSFSQTSSTANTGTFSPTFPKPMGTITITVRGTNFAGTLELRTDKKLYMTSLSANMLGSAGFSFSYIGYN